MNKRNIILSAIKNALGSDAQYFNVQGQETLEDTEETFSMSVSFLPKQIDIEGGVVNGAEQNLIFQLFSDDVPMLLVGEDSEQDITAANLYASLYWGEAVKVDETINPIAEITNQDKLASLKKMPYVTVEQVLALREAMLKALSDSYGRS